MKKLFVILVVMIGFAISANAQVSFRTRQSVCADGARIEFLTNGVVKFWENDRLTAEGKYTIDGTYIILDRELRLTASISNGAILNNVTFRKKTFYRCR
ncbi:MAG: hypothetical protein LBQ28_04935 [Prevotellaceae bacterium]|jgi:hypothetical protein|nr:hypothetical protein [Prevotellaceae bacterium]